LPSGRWGVRYRVDGKPVSPGLTFATRADAGAYLDSVRTDMDRGVWRDPRLGRRTFGDWANEYMATQVDLFPRSVAAYDGMLNNHILPAFGAMAINTIRPLAVRKLMAGMAEAGISASRRSTTLMLLCQILRAAVVEGLILDTPCIGIKPPQLPPPVPDYLTIEEIDRLLDALRPPWDLLIMTMIYGGLRYGEASSLRRSSCDLARSHLLIDESMCEVNGVIVFGPTKDHQHRYVSLPGFVRDRLATHLETEVGPEPDALLFTVPSGKPARYSNFRRSVWLPATRAAGLKGITTHLCRHTSATLLLAAGADVKDVQMHLGHKNAALTLNVYCAPYDGRSEELAARINRAWRVAQGEEDEAEPPVISDDPAARRRRRRHRGPVRRDR
ncbi:MAG TPA: site-specific integrase, partial [Acidimicrobiales bacterium]|nr:site-specific integrase [Acidimicrobiales bacterium]